MHTHTHTHKHTHTHIARQEKRIISEMPHPAALNTIRCHIQLCRLGFPSHGLVIAFPAWTPGGRVSKWMPFISKEAEKMVFSAPCPSLLNLTGNA